MSDRSLESITDLYYLVSNLVSEQRQFSNIPHDMSITEAIRIMDEIGISQIPVKSWNTLIGVFSYRSFCRTILEMDGEIDPNELIGDMSVGEFVEQHPFVNDDDYWESIITHLESGNCVLVGNRENFRASITPMDVVVFLYKVAKPFVAVAEIELSIRRMITSCVDRETLQDCFQNSLSQLYSPDNLPTCVTEMTFNDYVQVICDGRNWVHFEPFFGNSRGMRRHTRNYLIRIGELRNDIFHFRRLIGEDDIRFLNTKRDWFQNKARIYESKRRRIVDVAQIQSAIEVRSG